MALDRRPPTTIRRELQREVGYGCPVPVADGRCGSPYLYWHHFDPLWRERQHHEPAGMIALCGEHHPRADAGAYTADQLRAWKSMWSGPPSVVGRFEWMRRDLLAVVGGNFYLETPIIVQLQGQPIVWFSRDHQAYLRLSLRMPSVVPEPRLQLDENYWLLRGDPIDFVCPPSGRIVSARYENGDSLKVEFIDLKDEEAASRRYPDAGLDDRGLAFPMTAVEVTLRVGDTRIDFGPRETRVGGLMMRNCFMARGRVGLSID